MARSRPFRIEDLFSQNPSTPGPGEDPLDPTGGDLPPLLPEETVPELPPPGGGYPGPLPPLEGPEGPLVPPEPEIPGAPPGPAVPGGGTNSPLPPLDQPLVPPASPTSATAPGSFANPGSSAARPLQPFNYRSLFDNRNRAQGSLVPGARVPTTPANIAPQVGGELGGQSESAITRGLRRLRG